MATTCFLSLFLGRKALKTVFLLSHIFLLPSLTGLYLSTLSSFWGAAALPPLNQRRQARLNLSNLGPTNSNILNIYFGTSIGKQQKYPASRFPLTIS